MLKNTWVNFVIKYNIFFLGSLILFDILSNQKDMSISKSPGSVAVSNGVTKHSNFQEKQVSL